MAMGQIKRLSEAKMTNNKYSKAVLDKLRVSPRKLGLIVQQIRGCSVNKALDLLQFSRKRVAADVKKVLVSAISNAENNHNMDIDNLFIHHAYVGKSITLKRFQACAKGRGVAIRKPFSNMTIILTEKEV